MPGRGQFTRYARRNGVVRKKCCTCKNWKQLGGNFHRIRSGEPLGPRNSQNRCIPCAEAYRKENPPSASPEARLRRHLKRRFGLPLADYLAMVKRQRGRCLICGVKPKLGRLCVDHAHDTGRTRGLLCFHCNAGLGFFKDRPDLLHRAARYVEVYGG